MAIMYFAVCDPYGKITSTGTFLSEGSENQLSHLGANVVVSETPIDWQSSYLAANGEILPFPAKPSAHHTWDWTTRGWVEDFSKAQAIKSTQILAACGAQILSGFDSTALGATHRYPAKMTDQQNLASSVLASLLPGLPSDWTTPFWCADGDGVWLFRSHTGAQIQQVGQDAKAAILYAMGKNEQLQSVIAEAETIAELEVITW